MALIKGKQLGTGSNGVQTANLADLSVRVATTGNLSATFSSNTLVATSNGALSIDGINTTFTSPAAFPQISVFLNGVRQLNPGDYVIVNPTTIQTSLAPTGGY